MQPEPFQVEPFSGTDDSSFMEALGDPLRYPPTRVREHSQAEYLYNYLKDLGAATIVVEREYTDGDYLEDYAAFYATCFADYPRKCKRVHFFARAFARDEFVSVVAGGARDNASACELKSAYLGFIVVRPLPEALIGRTLLATYPRRKATPPGGREYWVVAKHDVHLFGMTLEVISLPFQEQDRAVAACATVALWSAFHKTADLFRTPVPRPPRITADATRGVISGRPLPSTGLSLEQMAEAIRVNGLDPEVFTLDATKPLLIPVISCVTAYLAMGLPVVLGVEVQGYGELHAITITGCSRLDKRVLPGEIAPSRNGVPLVQIPTSALFVDELYAHDDGVGPHSRLRIDAPTADLPADGKRVPSDSLVFEGQWPSRTQPAAKAKMIPHVLVVPVYRKIRLKFTDVHDRLLYIHQLAIQAAPTGSFVDWDIALTTSNNFKANVDRLRVSDSIRFRLMTEAQPRFIWRATLRINGQDAFELLADATGFDASFPFFDAILQDDAFGKRLTQMLAVNIGIVAALPEQLKQFIVTQFAQQMH